MLCSILICHSLCCGLFFSHLFGSFLICFLNPIWIHVPVLKKPAVYCSVAICFFLLYSALFCNVLICYVIWCTNLFWFSLSWFLFVLSWSILERSVVYPTVPVHIFRFLELYFLKLMLYDWWDRFPISNFRRLSSRVSNESWEWWEILGKYRNNTFPL